MYSLPVISAYAMVPHLQHPLANPASAVVSHAFVNGSTIMTAVLDHGAKLHNDLGV
jgi:hypothetical protein